MNKLDLSNVPTSSQQTTIMKTLIDTLKISAGWDLEANKLAGRLYHTMMNRHTASDVSGYLKFFENVLQDDVSEFLVKFQTPINNICAAFKNSPNYEEFVSRGILSATRLFDTYVLRTDDGAWFESPTQMFMRLSAFFTCQCFTFSVLKKALAEIEFRNHSKILKTKIDFFVYFFDVLSTQLVCCATPVMRSAGLKNGFLASCFIMNPDMSTEDQTLSALFKELSPLLCSKSGVGLNVGKFYAGKKNIQSCLRLINSQVEFCNDQNVRPVSVATYMELWHFQIEEFLTVKLPENPDRCQSIFQGVCIPSLFFKIYEKDPDTAWFLFNPEVATELAGLYGSMFEEEYYRLVEEKKYVSFLPAKSLMFALINTIIKTGSPYILCKEHINQHHWYDTQGNAISYANLCAEVIQQPNEYTSTCNLANICLPKCLATENQAKSIDVIPDLNKLSPLVPDVGFCFETLDKAVQAAVFMINAAILGGSCPTPGVRIMQSERSMGIGVQGLADVFAKMGLSYMNHRSAALDKAIFERMYFRAVSVSNQIITLGGAAPHANWKAGKLARGEFHWESFNLEDNDLTISQQTWDELRKNVMTHGTFNSQFLALMPTAGTSQVTGYSESFYPFYANVSSKVSNKEEVMRPNITFLESICPADLDILKFYSGDITKVPESLFLKYSHFLSAFDYSPEEQIERAKLRAPFIDQSQSFSLFLKESNVKSAAYLKNLLLFGYKCGLKTIMYYCRIQKQTTLSALECLQYNKSVDSLSEACAYKACDDEDDTDNSKSEFIGCLSCQ